MFSVAQKRSIAEKVQRILRETNHPELPTGEIQFTLHVTGAADWSWATIRNNQAEPNPRVNPWNEAQAERSEQCTGINNEPGFCVRHSTSLPHLRSLPEATSDTSAGKPLC